MAESQGHDESDSLSLVQEFGGSAFNESDFSSLEEEEFLDNQCQLEVQSVSASYIVRASRLYNV